MEKNTKEAEEIVNECLEKNIPYYIKRLDDGLDSSSVNKIIGMVYNNINIR